jgi:hypothetical protein
MSDLQGWQPGARPAWVTALNRLGDPSWISLEPETLVDEAMRLTGLSDFGDEHWRDGYGVFVEALEAEAQLHFVGRVLARSDLVNWLSNRLQMTDYARRNPTVAQEQIERPLFITGLPRTGTSILHELLAQDAASRAPLAWEVRHPCPPVGTAGDASDTRIGLADEAVRLWCEIVPEYDRMHELGGQLPVECIQITAHSFRSDELSGRHVVPSYSAWLATADLAPAYTFHKQMLKLLQSAGEPSQWVLKAPSHLAALDSLLAVYPDARIVWTHRDPLMVMASVASILFSTAWVRSDAVDPEAVLGWFTGPTCRALIDAGTAVRDRDDSTADQFYDVRYSDLMGAPHETIAGIYEHFGMPLSDRAQRAMRTTLEARPKSRHGAHQYDFASAAFDIATERARFTDYQARYRVPSEGH